MSFPLASPGLLTTFCVTMLIAMTTPDAIKDWLSKHSDQRVTAQDIADILDISRNTANLRLKKGLGASDLIDIARNLQINPVTALEELGYITAQEVMDWIDSDGTLLATASLNQLIYRLAEDGLSAKEKMSLVESVLPTEQDELAAKRSNKTPSNVHNEPYDEGTVTEWDDTVPHAADSSPDEDKMREERGESLFD